MKKILVSFVTMCALVVSTFVQVAGAAGSATENIAVSSSSIVNGSNVSVTISVSNISGVPGGVPNYQSTFIYDSAFFDYVSFSSSAPFGLSYNSTNGKIAGFNSEHPITGTSSNLCTIVLRAKQVGTTTVSTSGSAMGDINADRLSLTLATPRSITITAPVVLSSNNFLSALSVNGYAISPNFNRTVTGYTLTVSNSVSSVTINATKEDPTASVSGTGAKSLSVGSNTANVVVTAENGGKRTYTINITREAAATTPETPKKSNDATLKSLGVSGYVLTPSFNKNITNYSIVVPESLGRVDVNAVPTNAKASILVNGNANWSASVNNITVKVTAEDGTIKNYIITANRAGSVSANQSSNNYLGDINIENYPIEFNKETDNYIITVPFGIEKLNISTTVEDSKAKIEIIGNENFKSGEMNVVEIRVTAENGSLRIYTINVNVTSDPVAEPGEQEKNDEKTSKMDILGIRLAIFFSLLGLLLVGAATWFVLWIRKKKINKK
ncbi:cadherin-like beta sandwich domain-containing protein [Candidatus Saccharibacteria bacterium]|nr:cadherin-like beta sandwich domain-containing protein [Candidatus Saccharibacteria bacterium]